MPLNPWIKEITEYIEKNVFPCIRAEIERIAQGQADVEIRWLWKRPWEIHSSSKATIKPLSLEYSDPIHFTGGIGFWQIGINNKAISESDFVLVTVWDNEAGVVRTNLSLENFVNLLGSTVTEIPFKRTETAQKPTLPPFDVKSHREAREHVENEVSALRNEMEGALLSLGYKKTDINWSYIDRLVEETILNGPGTIEHCIKEFLRRNKEK